MNIPNQTMEQEHETKPLWKYVSKLRKTPGGGNHIIKCSLCDFTFNGSYTKIRIHLLKIKGEGVRICPKVTSAKLVEFKKLDNDSTRDTLDYEIARMFYSSGLPFHLARSPYYRSAFSYAANTSNLDGYVPPTYNKLIGPLLSKERSHIESLLQPIRNSWKEKGVTIISDG